MTYLTPTGEAVTDVRLIAFNYLKSEFKFDAVANFPIGIFCFAAPSGQRLQVLSYLRLLHLLRIYRLTQFVDDWLKKLNIKLVVVSIFQCQIALISVTLLKLEFQV